MINFLDLPSGNAQAKIITTLFYLQPKNKLSIQRLSPLKYL
ncbi:hypothetical protein AO385_1159 [Moraxella catarrhalis]|nr:hypothetical protein AO383_1463 [Moraxella catarrhalis]OAV00458.1 hypothetical protein AO385_1159 [Moraxella catarrhalis]